MEAEYVINADIDEIDKLNLLRKHVNNWHSQVLTYLFADILGDACECGFVTGGHHHVKQSLVSEIRIKPKARSRKK